MLQCDRLEGLSDDSDQDRNTKYNLNNDLDLIEEEGVIAEYDEEDDGLDDYGGEEI